MANTVWFVTTDNLAENDPEQNTTLYVYKWDGSSFTLIDSEASNLAAQWIEPPINLASWSGIHVVALQRATIGGVGNVPEIRVYDGETKLRVTQITDPAATGGSPSYRSMDGCRWLLMDSAGRIHVLVVDSDGGYYKLYHLVSTDNGATFTNTKLNDAMALPVFICQDSGGDLYVACNGDGVVGNIYKSTNNGATWTDAGSLPVGTLFFGIVNDTFFAVLDASTAYNLHKTTDLSSWGDAVLAMPGTYAGFKGIAMAYDNSTYYLVAITAGLGQPKRNYSYSSSDGATWNAKATFDSVTGEGADSQLLAAADGTLYFTAYYSETNDTNHFMSFWYSEDQEANWTTVTTPFWDANNGASPGSNPPYIPWYSCPQGILLPTVAGESASLSPSKSPSLSPSSSPSLSPSVSPSQPIMPINPYVMLTWSDDGGMTWSNEYWRPVGRIGEHRKRLIWRQLGRAKDRIFKIAVSDPCKWIFIDSIIDADEGTSRR